MFGFALICIWFAYYASQQHAPPNPFCSGNLFEHRGPSSNMPHISHITGCQHLHENMGKFSLKARISDIYIYTLYIITYNIRICAASVPRFCVFRSCSVFVLCGARACEQSLGNARTPQGRSACLSISLVECRKLCHSGIFRPELWHAWDRMSCDMSCDRPSQRGLGCKRLCSSCRAWKKTKAWSAESKF
jgi:hypothetical protein